MSTVAYQTLAEFRSASIMPGAFIDQLEQSEPGWIAGRLVYVSALMDARLAKRYAAPFKAPYPVAVCDWLARIVTYESWLKRGISPTDQEASEYKTQSDNAYADLKEAANSETGLFELPLRSNTDASGITRGFPHGYSESSPYVAFDDQARRGHQEDASGR